MEIQLNLCLLSDLMRVKWIKILLSLLKNTPSQSSQSKTHHPLVPQPDWVNPVFYI